MAIGKHNPAYFAEYLLHSRSVSSKPSAGVRSDDITYFNFNLAAGMKGNGLSLCFRTGR
jgi:hypothetical protein